MSTRSDRFRRRFSEPIKQESVQRIDACQVTITELSRELDVTRQTIYKWMSKYSIHYRKQHRVIVEKNSEQNRVKELQNQVKELEAALGRKQVKLDYLSKMIELTEQEDGIDILKKKEHRSSSGSEPTGKNTLGQ